MKAKRKTARSAKPASAPKTASDIVRELHKRHPDWSYAELATGCVAAGYAITRSGAQNALRAKHPGTRGRPPKHDAETIARLERELAAALAARDRAVA